MADKRVGPKILALAALLLRLAPVFGARSPGEAPGSNPGVLVARSVPRVYANRKLSLFRFFLILALDSINRSSTMGSVWLTWSIRAHLLLFAPFAHWQIVARHVGYETRGASKPCNAEQLRRAVLTSPIEHRSRRGRRIGRGDSMREQVLSLVEGRRQPNRNHLTRRPTLWH